MFLSKYRNVTWNTFPSQLLHTKHLTSRWLPFCSPLTAVLILEHWIEVVPGSALMAEDLHRALLFTKRQHHDICYFIWCSHQPYEYLASGLCSHNWKLREMRWPLVILNPGLTSRLSAALGSHDRQTGSVSPPMLGSLAIPDRRMVLNMYTGSQRKPIILK